MERVLLQRFSERRLIWVQILTEQFVFFRVYLGRRVIPHLFGLSDLLMQLEWRHSPEHDFLTCRNMRLMVLVEDLFAGLMAQWH